MDERKGKENITAKAVSKREEICSRKNLFLPPASEGWGKVLFSVCQFTPRWGGGGCYPIPGPGGWVGGGVPHPRFRWICA